VPTPADIHALFATYVDAWQRRDRAAFLALFTDDVVQVDPYPAEPNVGKDALGAFFDRTMAIVERMEFTVGRSIVAGDRGVFPITIRTGLAGGLSLEVDAIDVISVNAEGLVTSLTAYVDMEGTRLLD